jgi:hypothetical protein
MQTGDGTSRSELIEVDLQRRCPRYRATCDVSTSSRKERSAPLFGRSRSSGPRELHERACQTKERQWLERNRWRPHPAAIGQMITRVTAPSQKQRTHPLSGLLTALPGSSRQTRADGAVTPSMEDRGCAMFARKRGITNGLYCDSGGFAEPRAQTRLLIAVPLSQRGAQRHPGVTH